jgi:uncharacterized protein YycO
MLFKKKRKKEIIKDDEKDGAKDSSQSEFKARRKKLLRMSLVSFGLTLLSLAIVGMGIFYPFHIAIGLSLYAFSFISLVRRIYLGQKTWEKYRAYSFAKSFFKREKPRLVVAGIILVASMMFLWLLPLDHKPFAGYSNQELKQVISDDLYTSVSSMDYLESTGNSLLSALESKSEDSNTTENISNTFDEFLRAVAYSESLTETHRYFVSIPYRLRNERVTSFLISYSLYSKKYEIVHRIMSRVSGNEYQKKVLNQYMPSVERGNIYNEMVTRFYEPKTRVRLSGGVLYMRIFGDFEDLQTGAYHLLYEKADGSYKYLFDHFFSTLAHTGEILVDSSERKMFDTWFPIQKNIAGQMGHAILSTRGKNGFITPGQALAMEKTMQPGDIMLQRRNWHLSNVGIPGFWTHSALYTGDLSKMDRFFASEFPYRGYETFSEYMKGEFSNVYELYQSPVKDGNPRSVIEAIEPGVVIQSISTSADADFVVVLRPKLLSKHDILLALSKTFLNVGKPYDYNFDFDTRDTLVCSELVYDAYFERLPEKKGLHFTTSEINGRKIVTPLDMAKKFVTEKGGSDAEFGFVYFLRGNEKTNTSAPSTEAEFVKSISWSKFTFFQK